MMAMVGRRPSETQATSREFMISMPRPGRIVLSLPVDLPRPRRYGEVVTSVAFNRMKATLLDQLGKVAA